MVEQTPIEVGRHYQVPSPEDRIGPDGEGGYIHDPALMRKNPRSFHIIDPDISCPPTDQGYDVTIALLLQFGKDSTLHGRNGAH